MSDTVDQVLDSVTSAEPSEVVVEEASEEVAVEDPVASEAVEAPVASEAVEAPVASEEVEAAVEEPEPVVEPAPVAEPEPVSTQEVVQNVQEILSSTETNVSVDNIELENRVKVLEERLEKLIILLSDDVAAGWASWTQDKLFVLKQT